VDFGRHVIPAAVPRLRVQAHVHDGYWEDVGTIASYFEANLALTEPRPSFNFYDPNHPIYTHPRFLPATKVHACEIKDSLISEGCYIERARLDHVVVGIRTRIAGGARIRRSLLLGADSYETADETERAGSERLPPVGIGEEAVIENAIIDKNARIGRGVRITNERGERDRDASNYHIRDGVVVIPKGAVIPDGAVI
jgi:glucose-1-phosphate adenylyltransferase